MKKQILVLITLIIIFLTAKELSAYELGYTENGNTLKWPSNEITMFYNILSAPSGSDNAINAAMLTWNNVVNSSFTFTNSGNSLNSAFGKLDSKNIISFGSLSEYEGTLAINAVWYNPTTGELLDSDIRINTDYSFSTDKTSDTFDVQNILTHELGHSLFLSDLYNAADSEKTMYGYAGYEETKKRTLHNDDIAGICFLYPHSQPGEVSIVSSSIDTYTWTNTTTITVNWQSPEITGVGNIAGYSFIWDETENTDADTTAECDNSIIQNNSPALSDGDNHFFHIRAVDENGNWGDTTHYGPFYIDTIAPEIFSFSIENNAVATMNTTITLEPQCTDYYGSGIGTVQAGINGSPLSDTIPAGELTLPEDLAYGPIEITVQVTDIAGNVSNQISDNIIFSYNTATIVGDSFDAEEVTLHDLKSNLNITTTLENGVFTFDAIPAGLYGITLKNNYANKGITKRISVPRSLNTDLINLDTYSIGTESGNVTGYISTATDNVNITIGLNLGFGYFLPMQTTQTENNGKFYFTNLSPGLYSLQIESFDSYYYEPETYITVNSEETTFVSIILKSGIEFSGTTDIAGTYIYAKQRKGQHIFSVLTDNNGDFSFILPEDNYNIFTNNEYYCLPYTEIAMTDYPVTNQTLTMLSRNNETTGIIENIDYILTGNENNINKSIQINFHSQNNFCFETASSEYQNTISTEEYTFTLPETFIPADKTLTLTLVSSNFQKSIYSMNITDNTYANKNFTLNSAGGNINGSAAYNNIPIKNPNVLLYNSSGIIVGNCTGNYEGEYFFTNIPQGTNYIIKTYHHDNKIIESSPFDVFTNDNVEINLLENNFDLDGNNQVDIQDIILCINIILGKEEGYGDVNCDNQVDIQDIIAIANYILNL